MSVRNLNLAPHTNMPVEFVSMLGGWVNPHRATHYTARSNIEPAQIFLHANGQSAPRPGGARDVGRGAGSHTPSTASG